MTFVLMAQNLLTLISKQSLASATDNVWLELEILTLILSIEIKH